MLPHVFNDILDALHMHYTLLQNENSGLRHSNFRKMQTTAGLHFLNYLIFRGENKVT